MLKEKSSINNSQELGAVHVTLDGYQFTSIHTKFRRSTTLCKFQKWYCSINGEIQA